MRTGTEFSTGTSITRKGSKWGRAETVRVLDYRSFVGPVTSDTERTCLLVDAVQQQCFVYTL